MQKKEKKTLSKLIKGPHTRKSTAFSSPPPAKIRKISATNESILLKKQFRESPVVEKFYKNIYKYKLRKEAYKTAILIYLDLKQ